MYICDVFIGRREVLSLAVKCNYADLKCEWTGTVETLKNHLAICGATLIPCPNKCKPPIKRGGLQAHLSKFCPKRSYKCQHCKKEGTYIFITESHENTCQKKMISCPNAECNVTMERQKMVSHFNECMFSMIPCKYKSLGCDVTFKRRDKLAHESNSKHHLQLALDTVLAEKKKRSLIIKYAIAEYSIVAILFIHTCWPVTDVLGEISRTMLGCVLAAIFLIICIPFLIKLVKVVHILVRKYRKRSAYKIFAFSVKECYPMDKKQTFLSPPFYTSPFGYKLAIRVEGNGMGTGQGTHVSVFVRFLAGEHDDLLQWPFTGRMTVMLMNQLEDKNHHKMALLVQNKLNARVGSQDFGLHQFIPHASLAFNAAKNTEYLKNGTLFFKVMVSDVPNHRPWLETTEKSSLSVYHCDSMIA